VAGLVANLVYLVNDAPWLKALGDLVTTGIALAVLTRVWQVFPFDFGESTVDWPLFVRFVLIVAIVGTVIGLVVQFLTLVRAAARR
jgi:predicted membrane protein